MHIILHKQGQQRRAATTNRSKQTNKQLTWLALKIVCFCGQNLDESVVTFAWQASSRHAAYAQFLPA